MKLSFSLYVLDSFLIKLIDIGKLCSTPDSFNWSNHEANIFWSLETTGAGSKFLSFSIPTLSEYTKRLYDRLWFFLTESLLAFTIFRDEFDAIFGMMFSFLLFVKCFHWLMADRIEWV